MKENNIHFKCREPNFYVETSWTFLSEGRDSTGLLHFWWTSTQQWATETGTYFAISAHHISNGISNLVVPMGRSEGNSELYRSMETLWHYYWQFEHITFTCFHHNSSDLASFFQYISHQTCDKRYSHNSVELFLSFIHPILLSIVFFFSKHACIINQVSFFFVVKYPISKLRLRFFS